MTRAVQQPRIGLVLGGGGLVGAAFHAGALAALHSALGLDSRCAETIVGTSAGSLVGALLRRGVPPGDLAALTVGGRAETTPSSIAECLCAPPVFPPFELRSLLRRPRLPRPDLMAALWLRTLRSGSS